MGQTPRRPPTAVFTDEGYLRHGWLTTDSAVGFPGDGFTGGGSSEFVVPWLLVAIILAIAFATVLLMTWVPSRQVAPIAPAEALRYE